MSTADAAKVNIYYLIGAGRSGTTLLSRLLQVEGGHVALGEVRYIGLDETWEDPCGCGEPHHTCRFWGPHIENLRAEHEKHWREVVSPRQVDQLAYFVFASRPPARLRQGLDYLSRLYHSLDDSGRVLVDESKLPWLGFVLSNQPWADVRFIELVRQPDDVVRSWTRRKSYTPALPSEDVARNWLRTHMTADLMRRRFGGPWLRLPYTTLANDPHGCLTTILGDRQRAYERLTAIGPSNL